MSRSSKKVAELLREGAAHFRKEEFEHARVCWEVALELEPNNLHVQKYLALLDDEAESSLPAPKPPLAAKEQETPTLEELPAVAATPPPEARAIAPEKKTPIPKPWRPLQRTQAPNAEQRPPETAPWRITGELELPLESVAVLGGPAKKRSRVSSSSSTTHTAISPEMLRSHMPPASDTSFKSTQDIRSIASPSDIQPSKEAPTEEFPTDTNSEAEQKPQAGSSGSLELPEASSEKLSAVETAKEEDDAADAQIAAPTEEESPAEEPPPEGGAIVEKVDLTVTKDDVEQLVDVAQSVSVQSPQHRFYDEPSPAPVVVEKPAPTPAPLQTTPAPAPIPPAPKALTGESFAKALDNALAKEFSALLGDNAPLAQATEEAPPQEPIHLDQSLPLIEYVREFLLQMLSINGDVAFAALMDAFLKRDMEPLMDHWPLPPEVLDGIINFFDKFTRHAMQLYVQRKHVMAYRLYLLCFCARPDDKRVQNNLDKLKKRLEIK